MEEDERLGDVSDDDIDEANEGGVDNDNDDEQDALDESRRQHQHQHQKTVMEMEMVTETTSPHPPPASGRRGPRRIWASISARELVRSSTFPSLSGQFMFLTFSR